MGKAGLEAVAACAVRELGSKGLAATIVRPGFVDTPFLRSFEPRYVEILREKGLVRSPREIVSVIVDAARTPPPAGSYVIRSI